ncbi:MAG: hypothetical protein EAZ15_08195 [Sphingobacteriales bacterium]|nr:MAG: hypothetical protein EAZ15_08195 [Sphingobacteriales bacterium]
MYKTLLNRLLSVFILCITLTHSDAQILDQIQNPCALKFNQINTKNFQIIYPIGLETEAQKVANTLNTVIASVSKTLNKPPHPISIILQNQGVISNAFVSMAPRRSEFYTIPGQEFDMQDWVNGLCIHELRHVVQFDKVAGYLGKPLFEELKLALFGINLPPWYFEGDAVGIETALTPAGRGRQPIFEMVLRTNLLSNKNFSYSKNYLGSIKNNTPGYYPLGYFMVSKMRRDFGADILDKTLTRIAKFPIRPYSFSNSFKKYSGYNTRQLYLKTMVEMDSLWQLQAQQTKGVNYASLNPQTPKTPTDYLFPFLIDDGNIICLKNSKGITPAITLLSPQGKQKTLVRIAYQTEPNLHYANGVLVWDEYRSDERFHQRSFSVINTYNLKTKIHKQLTYKSRLFSPALSADAKTIIAVKVSTQNKFELVELDAITGKQLQTYPNPDSLALQFPRFDDAGERIVVTALSQNGKTLLVYNRNQKTFEQILPFSRQLINRPFFYKNQVIYKAHYNGIDNMYSINLANKKISQLTNAQFGAFNANITANKLLFNDYQYNGYNIVQFNVDSLYANADTAFINNFVEYFKPLIEQENGGDVLKNIPNKIYNAKPYSELGHLFYFHSISPITNGSDFFDSGVIGLDILSNNKLSTLAFAAGYQYQQNLQRSQYHFSLSYAKYYPVISFNYQNRPQMGQAKATQNNQTVVYPFYWRENYSQLSLKLPYKTNWLNQNLTMAFDASTSYTQRYNTTLKVANFITSIKFPLQYQYSFNLNQSQSSRDLAPRFGQNISFGYSHLPFNTKKGQLALMRSQFYFPGLFANHSLQASYNMQNANGVYNFDIDIPRASGTANIDAIGKIKNTLLLDYRFPIAYPDFELGPLAYIKRFKGGFFVDFENLGTGSKALRTYGVELRADMNLLRYYLPNFDIGGKIIKPVNNRSKSPIFEFGFNYNL